MIDKTYWLEFHSRERDRFYLVGVFLSDSRWNEEGGRVKRERERGREGGRERDRQTERNRNRQRIKQTLNITNNN